MTRKGIFRIGVYGLLVQEEAVLMTLTDRIGGAKWNFPGGGLEYGERPVDALSREFYEETGQEIAVGPLLYASEECYIFEEYPGQQSYCVYYEVALKKELTALHSPEAPEVKELRWVPLQELPDYDMVSLDQHFVQAWLTNRRS